MVQVLILQVPLQKQITTQLDMLPFTAILYFLTLIQLKSSWLYFTDHSAIPHLGYQPSMWYLIKCLLKVEIYNIHRHSLIHQSQKLLR